MKFCISHIAAQIIVCLGKDIRYGKLKNDKAQLGLGNLTLG